LRWAFVYGGYRQMFESLLVPAERINYAQHLLKNRDI
jgi:hypothetical protein